MSTSSGEEVNMEELNETVPDKSFHWHEKDVWNLATYVFSKMTPDACISPFNTVNVDWDDVEEAVGTDLAKCKRKWSELLNSVRQYRTLPEIICDILSENTVTNQEGKINFKTLNKTGTKSQRKKKKKKKPVNPDHPKRPASSGYSVFTSEMSDKIAAEDRNGINLFLKIGHMWKELSASEKERYNMKSVEQKEAYLKEVQEYAQLHPDDVEIQKILAEEMARKPKKGATKRKVSVEVADVPEQTDEINTTVNTEVVTSCEDSFNKSPKKKKKIKSEEKGWSAEDSFLESRFDEYKQDHPDLSDEEVKQKIMKKFTKLSAKKLEKYKRMAEEKNS